MTEAEKRAEDRAERRLRVEEQRLGIAIEQLGLDKEAALDSYEAGDNIESKLGDPDNPPNPNLIFPSVAPPMYINGLFVV